MTMVEVPRSTQSHPPNPDTPSTSFKRLYGSYQDGKWWCNCQPNRRPAALREVTRDTPNKGKFFWTCPLFNGCNFFLFWEEARVRERGLVTTTLPDGEDQQPPRPKTPTLTQPKLTKYGVQVTPSKRRNSSRSEGEEDREESEGVDSASMTRRGYPSGEEMARALRTPESGKRQRRADAAAVRGSDDSTDEFSDFAVDSDDERQLITLTDASAKKATAVRPGAAAAAGKHELVTPATGTRTVEGLPTPSSVSRTLFPSEGRTRRKSVSFEAPTPSKSGDADEHGGGADDLMPDSTTTTQTLDSSSTLAGTLLSTDPTTQILSLLSSTPSIPSTTQQTIRQLLETSARRSKGVEKSRDGLREELKRQKARNAKLQEQIATLEDKLRVKSRSMTSIKAGLMELYEEN